MDLSKSPFICQYIHSNKPSQKKLWPFILQGLTWVKNEREIKPYKLQPKKNPNNNIYIYFLQCLEHSTPEWENSPCFCRWSQTHRRWPLQQISVKWLAGTACKTKCTRTQVLKKKQHFSILFLNWNSTCSVSYVHLVRAVLLESPILTKPRPTLDSLRVAQQPIMPTTNKTTATTRMMTAGIDVYLSTLKSSKFL